MLRFKSESEYGSYVRWFGRFEDGPVFFLVLSVGVVSGGSVGFRDSEGLTFGSQSLDGTCFPPLREALSRLYI